MLIYVPDEKAGTLKLIASGGMKAYAGPARPGEVNLDADGTWPLAESLRSGQELLVDDITERFGALPAGSWGARPQRACVLPLHRTEGSPPRAVMVAGMSPHRALDERYRLLLRAAADQVTSVAANARAYEEERRRAEALAEIDRSKIAFFSNVSHEFRTPLTLILGPVEKALSEPEHALLGSDLEAVHRSSLRLLRLVNSLLEFTRAEAGRFQVSFEPVDLAVLTAGLAGSFQSLLEDAGLRLIVDCAPLPEPIYVDRSHWEKVVLNLISNAFKFTFEGQIGVVLRWQEDRVELRISDTGTGIPEPELSRIFERFHRVEGARGRSFEGTGIGLALVHELVKLHGGSVAVQSTEGEGSTFIVSLPTGSQHLPQDRIAIPRKHEAAGNSLSPYVLEAAHWTASADPSAPALADRDLFFQDSDVSSGWGPCPS